jgi:hypothetical protein
MSTSFIDRALPSASLTLTVKVEGMPAVHFTYDHSRAVEETAVTVLDQNTSGPWSFRETVWQALVFLLNYWASRSRWPAELRSPCAGRRKTDESS